MPDYDPTQLYQRQVAEERPDEWLLARRRRHQHQMRERWRAYYAVKTAIKRGVLLRLPHPFVHCVDCGRPAHAYDHRDYREPLEVRAVCDKCNYRRNHAKATFSIDFEYEERNEEELLEPEHQLILPSQALTSTNIRRYE